MVPERSGGALGRGRAGRGCRPGRPPRPRRHDRAHAPGTWRREGGEGRAGPRRAQTRQPRPAAHRRPGERPRSHRGRTRRRQDPGDADRRRRPLGPPEPGAPGDGRPGRAARHGRPGSVRPPRAACAAPRSQARGTRQGQHEGHPGVARCGGHGSRAPRPHLRQPFRVAVPAARRLGKAPPRGHRAAAAPWGERGRELPLAPGQRHPGARAQAVGPHGGRGPGAGRQRPGQRAGAPPRRPGAEAGGAHASSPAGARWTSTPASAGPCRSSCTSVEPRTRIAAASGWRPSPCRYPEASWKLEAPSHLRFAADELSIEPMRLLAEDQVQAIRLGGWKRGNRVDATVGLQTLDLGKLPKAPCSHPNVPLAGRVTLDARVKGPLDDPSVEATVDAADVTAGKVQHLFLEGERLLGLAASQGAAPCPRPRHRADRGRGSACGCPSPAAARAGEGPHRDARRSTWPRWCASRCE